MKKPILLVFFNRFVTTAKNFEEIKDYAPTELYLASDVPEGIILEDDYLPQSLFSQLLRRFIR